MASSQSSTRSALQARLDQLQSTRGDRASGDQAQRLIEDLQVYQIELEIQNQNLCEAQSLLEQSRDRYADLYDFAPVGYLSLDAKGRILEINLTGAILLGVDRAHVMRYPFSAFVVHQQAEFFQHLKHTLSPEHDDAMASVELAVKTRGGGMREVRLESVMSRHEGMPVCRSALIDVTERRRAEEALRHAREELEIKARMEHMKDEFVSTVSHELRTPLTSIIGALGLLANGVLQAGSEQEQTMLRIAYGNSLRLQRLIDDLLDMERLAAGKMSFDMQVQDVMPLVEQAVRDNQAYAERFNVSLRLSGDNPHLRVCVDALRMQQVLANFLSNAAKFSPPGATVDIAVSRCGSRVRVEVTDYGPGIPETFQLHVFERFSRADASTTQRCGGTGLGLAISKEIVQHMHGTIGFVSRAGRGACFHFELPAW